MPETTLLYLREHQSYFKRIYSTARIEIALEPKTAEDALQIVSMSDDQAKVLKPTWFQNNCIGYLITSYEGKLKFIAKTTADGQIKLNLRGMDVRDLKDKSKRVPYWIDYTALIVNGQTLLDTLTPAWHDKPYRYITNVKAGDELTIEVEWLPHKDSK